MAAIRARRPTQAVGLPGGVTTILRGEAATAPSETSLLIARIILPGEQVPDDEVSDVLSGQVRCR
ncbi:hypothetical protein AB0F52_15225 [Amycolatopsis sp. NPDC024027]|uniref:hypothetical protein n=1 Tax=Amycolatopsis sp. NPDC024027 TaxID=3154327 RepID=UPI0033C70A7C